jgi:hypothetical protein
VIGFAAAESVVSGEGEDTGEGELPAFVCVFESGCGKHPAVSKSALRIPIYMKSLINFLRY